MATALLERWEDEGVSMHAPLLAKYEVANTLTQKCARNELSQDDANEALVAFADLDIEYDVHPDNARAIEIALELMRHSAYDASYLALAERLDAELWTLDGPLARNAGGRGYRLKLID